MNMNKWEEHECMVYFQGSSSTTAAYVKVSWVFAFWPKCDADSGLGGWGCGDQAPAPISPGPWTLFPSYASCWQPTLLLLSVSWRARQVGA